MGFVLESGCISEIQILFSVKPFICFIKKKHIHRLSACYFRDQKSPVIFLCTWELSWKRF